MYVHSTHTSISNLSDENCVNYSFIKSTGDQKDCVDIICKQWVYEIEKRLFTVKLNNKDEDIYQVTVSKIANE